MRYRDGIETLYFSHLESPIGVLGLVASGDGLVAIEFADREFPPSAPHAKANYVQDGQITLPFANQLTAYFRRELRHFKLALDLRGTDFQKQCWQALLAIPYGETRSYADIARAVGRPTAFRAVGMANHSNPIPIIVPCHRVLASTGSLCGYGGGLEVKRKLLELEGAWPKAGSATAQAAPLLSFT
jgi:O-6-methylguanine DNA methyltransferase